jgi:TolA-binding protein
VGVVGVALSRAPRHTGSAPAPAPAVVAPRVEEAPSPADTASAPALVEKRAEKVHRRATPPAPAADLRDQIALIDAARTAVKAGATDRALALLRRYEANYPGGAFRPEALALRVEALEAGGHGAEARALAREFLARYPQSPVADRVARIAH